MKRQLVILPLLALLSCAPKEVAPPRAHPPAAPAPKPSAPDQSFRLSVPSPGRPAKLVYPAAELMQLENGLSLAVVRRPVPVATVALVVRHGQSSVATKKSGLAALTARLLTEGTERRSALELAEAVEALGSSLEHDAGRDESSLSLRVLTQDVRQALDLLAEVVQQPAFDPKVLARVKAEWLDGLKAERQSPTRLSSLAGLRLLLGPDHGAPVAGSIADVTKLTRADLVGFHRQRYTPASAAVVLVGDISPEAARSAVTRAFGNWKSRPPAPLPALSPIPAPAATRVVLIDRPDSVQSALFVAQQLPSRSGPGHEARLLLSSVVGGLFTSRINHNLREQHAYTYGARSNVAATRDWGAFVVQTSVETEYTADALFELVRELRRARDPSLGAPISEDEVARARADLTSTLGAHLEQTDRIASDVASVFVHGLPSRYHADFEAKLAVISTADVTREALRLDPDRLVVVVVGAGARTKNALEQRGFSVVDADAALTR